MGDASKIWKTTDLDTFVAAIDSVGGLGSAEAQPLLADFRISFETPIDVSLDPYGDAYVEAQIALYREISGRTLDQSANELTQFDIEAYTVATNPYGWHDPSKLVLHHLRIGTALRRTDLPVDPRILDLGAGWGLTSEFMAILGGRVVAVDINPDFVTLINRRAKRQHLRLEAIEGTFDNFEVDGKFDLAFFYESLHHSIRPWNVVARCTDYLKSTGKIAFAAEPIQDTWWPHWGLRLDGGSIYCIHKFGWFENGFSQRFATDMFSRAGLILEMWPDFEPSGGWTGVARPMVDVVAGQPLWTRWLGRGWTSVQQAFCSGGDATLHIPDDVRAAQIDLALVNYRSRDLHICIANQNGDERYTGMIPSGRAEIAVALGPNDRWLSLVSDVWVPAEEYDTIDARRISFDLERIDVKRRPDAS